MYGPEYLGVSFEVTPLKADDNTSSSLISVVVGGQKNGPLILRDTYFPRIRYFELAIVTHVPDMSVSAFDSVVWKCIGTFNFCQYPSVPFKLRHCLFFIGTEQRISRYDKLSARRLRTPFRYMISKSNC